MEGDHPLSGFSYTEGCWEPKVCARNRAISLADKPTGTGVIGCVSGSTAGDDEDSRWRATTSVSGFSTINGCRSDEIPVFRVPEWFKFGTKGVTIACRPASREPAGEDETDLGLAHLDTVRR